MKIFEDEKGALSNLQYNQHRLRIANMLSQLFVGRKSLLSQTRNKCFSLVSGDTLNIVLAHLLPTRQDKSQGIVLD